MRRVLWSLAVLALLGRAMATAQPPSGQWWILHQEAAKPSQLAAYEATSKEFAAIVKANKAAMPTFNFMVFQGEDFTFTYAAPIKNFAGIDAINSEFGALMQAAGAKFMDLMQRGSPTMDHWSEWVVGEEPSMGYKPASPRIKAEDGKYFHWSFYYVVPGKEEDAKAIGKDFAALYASKGVTDGYNIYWAMNGPDLPLLIVEQWAKDEADFHASEAKNNALLGDAAKPLNERALAITRRYEAKSGWLRADLSVWPEMAKETPKK